MAQELQVFVTALLTWALATLFVHLSAKIIMGESHLPQAFLAVLVGTVMAAFVDLGGRNAGWPGPLVIVLGLAAFALGLAAVYRASWFKGALLGVVAWILWGVVRYLIGLLF